MRSVPLKVLELTILAAPLAAQQPLTFETVVTGLSRPLFVTHAPGDPAGRIFVVCQPGTLRIVQNGALLPTPFLDLSSKLTYGGEQGLLGLAFHPEYEQNGWFYVNYTDNTGGDTVIERYTVDPLNPDLAQPGSASLVIEIDQPYANHNGGWIAFGPDGYLYVGMGDGGGSGDPQNRAQDGQQLLGKMLRLDLDHTSGAAGYGIPPSNPFVSDPNVRDEIWALGLRNPWRCDFDNVTRKLWIADVGEAEWEEVDFEPAGQGGRNYGWRVMEGSHCFNPPTGCNQSGLVLPIHEYDHAGPPARCSVIGGVAYRGRAMATMHGRYFFADWCSAEIWSLRQAGGQAIDFVDHSAELAGLGGPLGWGEDADGEMYHCVSWGAIRRIVPAGPRLKTPRLEAGASVAVGYSGGAPNSACGLLYSLTGTGTTWIGAAGIDVDLDRPRLARTGTTDGAGRATFTGTVPAAFQGRTLWLQAVQWQLKSNVTVDTVD